MAYVIIQKANVSEVWWAIRKMAKMGLKKWAGSVSPQIKETGGSGYDGGKENINLIIVLG